MGTHLFCCFSAVGTTLHVCMCACVRACLHVTCTCRGYRCPLDDVGPQNGTLTLVPHHLPDIEDVDATHVDPPGSVVVVCARVCTCCCGAFARAISGLHFAP